MDMMMTIVAWGMIGGMVVGAIGGWLIFVIAWLATLHGNGTFEAASRRLALRWRVLFRRHEAPEPQLRTSGWKTLSR